jgi:hypothetical protein
MHLAAVAVALQATGWSSPVRTVVVVAFVSVGPGWAVLGVWDLAHGWAGVAIAIALSLSLATIVPGAFLYAGHWSPNWTLASLAALTFLASSATVVRHLMHPYRPSRYRASAD